MDKNRRSSMSSGTGKGIKEDSAMDAPMEAWDAASRPASGDVGADRPNILWICTDQQRHDTIGALGNPHIRTPHLDRLVREGVAFTRAYAQCTVCTPSRASFLTGRYPRTTGVTKNGGAYFPADEVLVTRLLADAGYDGGLIGKLHLSSAKDKEEQRLNDGYRVYEWSHSPLPDQSGANRYQQWLERQEVRWEDVYRGTEGGMPPHLHQSCWCAEEAVRFIRDSVGGKPWFLSVNLFDPHNPFDPPQEYRDRYDPERLPLPRWKEGELNGKPLLQQKDYVQGGQDGSGPSCARMSDSRKRQYIADYYAMIELIDDQVGRMLQALEETGQRERTLVVFMSDHGEMLGDHGLILKGAYFYDGLVRVPLLMSWPGKLQSGVRSDALVELVDLAPTLLELAGLVPPPYMQGRSLAPLLRGERSSGQHREHVYCEYYDALLGVHNGVKATMYFDGRWKIVVYHGEPLGELYDHQLDPDEFVNLWDVPQYAGIRAEYIAKCFDSSIATVDPNPPFAARW